MDDLTFNKFKTLIYERSGIFLKEAKKALVDARIANRMHVLGLGDPKDYFKYVMGDPSGDEVVSLLDAISTNVTFFFREDEHFRFLRKVAEKLFNEAGVKRLRIWSAACSTGEEPYSIAMTLHDVIRGRPDIDCRILATDISTRVLQECMKGTYAANRVEKVPPEYLSKYFTREKGPGPGGGQVFTVREDIRSMVRFSRINLSAPPFPMQGPFDFVFCRNVMIYFDAPVRQRLVTEMTRLLRPGGFLMVGHSETLAQMSDGLKTVKPSVYRKGEG